jgi:DNA-binding MarR family transcriptional regulator
MKLEELDIWGAEPPEPWVRAAADRWANLMEKAAVLFMDLLASSPLPRTETELLVLLWKEPDAAEPAILAERLRVSRQSMTGFLDKLESGRYVARSAHPTDRRRTVVRLKPKGLAVVRSFAAGILRREAALFASRSEAEVNATLFAFESILNLAANWMPDGKVKSE